jgi:hypothetical protein
MGRSEVRFWTSSREGGNGKTLEVKEGSYRSGEEDPFRWWFTTPLFESWTCTGDARTPNRKAVRRRANFGACAGWAWGPSMKPGAPWINVACWAGGHMGLVRKGWDRRWSNQFVSSSDIELWNGTPDIANRTGEIEALHSAQHDQMNFHQLEIPFRGWRQVCLAGRS